MNLYQETKFIMNEYNITANKGYGQNFLVNENIVSSIVEKADVNKEDLIIDLKSHPNHLPEDSYYFLQRLEESINHTLFSIDCKLKQLYKLGVDVNEC